MEDWEDISNPVKVVDTWEDESYEVPESWDADEKPKEESKPKPQAPKKLTAKEKIAQREARRQKVVDEMLEKQKELETRQLSEREREELAKEQEAKLIQDSFGLDDAPIPRNDELDFSKVSTKQDFNDLSVKLVAKFKNLEVSPHYSSFAEDFIRQISLQMELDNLKELSTSISALVSEKQRLSNKNKTRRKGPKPKLVLERDVNDFDQYAFISLTEPSAGGRFTDHLNTQDISNPVKVVDTWEDESYEVPESWDADEKPKEESKPKPQAPKKLTAKEKIAQREARRQKVVDEMLEKQKELETRQLSEREREELAKEQEAKLIQDSFGLDDAPIPRNDELDFSKVSTKQDFNDLSVKLVAKFKNLEVSPHYSSFAEDFIRQISLQMELDNLKELSTSISALVSEKQRLSNKNKTRRKGPKPKLVLERDVNDFDQYGDDADIFNNIF
nr:hypothetical transcript [Hymenolepis microstoma]